MFPQKVAYGQMKRSSELWKQSAGF